MREVAREEWKKLLDLISNLQDAIQATTVEDKGRMMARASDAYALIARTPPANIGRRIIAEVRREIEGVKHYYTLNPGPGADEAAKKALETLAHLAGIENQMFGPGLGRTKAIPLPDPLGILEAVSGGDIQDPIKAIFGSTRGGEGGAPPPPGPGRIAEYLSALEHAYRVAPCEGCVTLVQSCYIGGKIYEYMTTNNKTRNDMTVSEIDTVKREALESLSRIQR